MMRKVLGGLGVLACGAMAMGFATSTVSLSCGGTSSSGGSSSGGGSSSSGGSSSGSSGSGSSGDAGTNTYCDGFAMKDGSGNHFLLETYSFSGSLKAGGCYVALGGYIKGSDAGILYVDGYSATTAGGIWDVDQEYHGVSEGTGATPISAADPALFVAGCDDMGLGTGLDVIDGDGGMNFTAPAGGLTVASVVSAAALAKTATMYGVVTAIYPWTPAAGSTAAKSGSFYIQDAVAAGGTPAAGSGTLAYMNKADVGSNVPPNRGDVVALTGFSWSPYNGHNGSSTPPLPGYTNSQLQVQSNPAATVTVIGTAPLPPPVSLTAADLSPTGTSEKSYYGMRVSVSGGPFTVDGTGVGYPPSWTCPIQLQTL